MKSNESEMERLRKKVEQLERKNQELLQNRLSLLGMLGDVKRQLNEEYSQAKIAQAKYLNCDDLFERTEYNHQKGRRMAFAETLGLLNAVYEDYFGFREG